MSAKRPFVKFFYRDWLSDAALRRCCPATRGIWLDLICMMHDADAGEVAGSLAELARQINVPADEFATALAELKRTGTADVERVDDAVVVCSRRMAAEAARRRRDRNRKAYKRAWNARDYWDRRASDPTAKREPVLRYVREIRTDFGQNSDKIRTKFGQNSDNPVFDANPNRLPVKSGGEGTSATVSASLIAYCRVIGNSDNPSAPDPDGRTGGLIDLGRWDANQRAELSGRASELAAILGGARTIRPADPRDRRLVIGVAALVQLRAINDEEIRTATRAAGTKPRDRRVAYFYGTLRRVVAERDGGPTLDEMLNGLRIPPAPFPRGDQREWNDDEPTDDDGDPDGRGRAGNDFRPGPAE